MATPARLNGLLAQVAVDSYVAFDVPFAAMEAVGGAGRHINADATLRFRFFMEEFRSRRCSDGRSGLPAEGDAVGVQRTGS
jgi:hypothetical protein